MEFWMKFLLIMASVALADVCWAMYFIKIGDKSSIKAGFWASLLIVLSAYTTVNYVHDSRFIIPAALGAFIGTYISVEWSKRKEKKLNK